ncbi:MAG: hypothetical protein FWC87_04645 [Acidimicrobiaceae bacterium]|nr:hypothetical protein [Acidimicrobiaceae bacterium]
MVDSTGSEPVTVQSGSYQRTQLIFAAFFVVIALVFLVVAVTAKNPIGLIITAVVVLAIAAVFVKGSFACAVFDYRTGTLVVRNIRARKIPMSQVSGFDTVWSRQKTTSYVGARLTAVCLKDGSHVLIPGASTGNDSRREEILEELESALAKWNAPEPARRRADADPGIAAVEPEPPSDEKRTIVMQGCTDDFKETEFAKLLWDEAGIELRDVKQVVNDLQANSQIRVTVAANRVVSFATKAKGLGVRSIHEL